MNEHHCEKEQSVVAVLRGGSRDPAILAHARNCPVCSEVMLVTEFLREETNLVQHELNTLPDAALIWRKAEALAREKALARATLPIRITRISAFAVALFAALWLILESRQPGSWAADLWPRHLSFTILWPWNLKEPALLIALTSTLICFGLSSWYMLRED